MSNRTPTATVDNGHGAAVDTEGSTPRVGEGVGRQRVSLVDRTLSNLSRALRGVGAGTGGRLRGGAIRPDLPAEDRARVGEKMVQCLTGPGGEVSRRARAAELGRLYLSLDPDGKERFLRLLAREFDVDHVGVEAAIARYTSAVKPETRTEAAAALRRTLRPPRLQLLQQFSSLPEGVKFLVNLRADLLPAARRDSGVKAMDEDLRGVLSGMFDIGLLDLRRITWEAPAALLEKLIAYEAVHEIRSWDDLKNRLESDRRCYAFFHPKMPDEPLIFVEVALVEEMAGNVQDLLDENAPTSDGERAKCAVFYSISNAQKGLAGFSFGNFLIKRVVDDLSGRIKGIKTFATLSPIPGFRRWLDPKLEAGEDDLLLATESEALAALDGDETGVATLRRLLDSDWVGDETVEPVLKGPLMRLAAHYLLEEKRKGRARDGVANFHLSNGARMERLNWLGDRSAKGLKESAGMMINYLYKLSDIEANHEAYTGDGRIVCSPQIRALLKGG